MTEDDVLIRQMAETIGAVFWLADVNERRILYVSSAYDRIWGRDRQRLYTHYDEFFASIHPDDHERVQSASSRCVLQEQFEVEYRIVRPDGAVRWVRDRGFLIRDQAGNPDRIAGFAEDVTEARQLEHDRTRVEEALRVSEERLQTAQRAGNVGIWDWDAATGKTYWSETMWRLYGYESPPDQTGDEIWETRQHPEDQPRSKAGVAQFLASNATDYHDEFRIIQPNGLVRWIEAVAQLVRDEAGNPVRMSGVNLDITERKQAEIALAQSRYQFEKIAATTPDLVYVFDLVEERNTYVNAGIERILGYSPAQIASLGSSLIGSLIHPDDIPGVIESNQRFRDLDDQAVYDHELRMRHASGEYRWLRCRDAVFERTADGTVTQIIGTAQDITDRKQAEAALRESEEKYRLLFTSINEGYALCELLYDDNETPIDWRILEVNPAFEFLTGLTDAARKTARELNQPLNANWLQTFGTVARTGEATRFEHHISSIDYWFEVLVSRLDADQHHIVVVFNNISDRKQAEQEREQLLAREQQYTTKLRELNQAALALNAALTLEGVLNVVAEQAYRIIGTHQSVINLVLDGNWSQTKTIKGIKPEFLPYIFEHFRQEDGATTRKFGGLGLGLAIARQIVEMHGGTIKAESQGEGMGATFIVELPLSKSGGAREWRSRGVGEGLREQCPPSLTGLHILLVDDETDTREFQAFVLEQSGANVTAVASGFEALQALDQFTPDVLVSDIGMAEMDGYTLMQQIRSRLPNQGGTIPAIALTAYARNLDQQQAIAAGFQKHLTKPIEPESLISAIVNLLKESRAR